MELKIEGGSIVLEMMKKGILINCTMGNVLRFLPPLHRHRERGGSGRPGLGRCL